MKAAREKGIKYNKHELVLPFHLGPVAFQFSRWRQIRHLGGVDHCDGHRKSHNYKSKLYQYDHQVDDHFEQRLLKWSSSFVYFQYA